LTSREAGRTIVSRIGIEPTKESTMHRSRKPAWIAACAAVALVSSRFAAPTASADPYVSLSWSHAAGPTSPIVDQETFTGPGPYDVYVSLTGQSVPVRAFELLLYVSEGPGFSCYLDTPRPLAAAWRFDDAGCARGNLCYQGSALVSTDPAAQASTVFITDLTYDGTNQVNKLTYVEGDPAPLLAPDPTQTYRLAHFRFNHQGTCAGEADSVNVRLGLAHWVDASSTSPEYEWTLAGQALLGWNTRPIGSICFVKGPSDPSLLRGPIATAIGATSAEGSPSPVTQAAIPACDAAVPARPASWGLVKATYR
jgi:hypothetical protein